MFDSRSGLFQPDRKILTNQIQGLGLRAAEKNIYSFLSEVGKTRDGQTPVTVKFGKTRECCHLTSVTVYRYPVTNGGKFLPSTVYSVLNRAIARLIIRAVTYLCLCYFTPTALHWAVISNNHNVIRTLLKAGASMDVLNAEVTWEELINISFAILGLTV